MNQFIAKYQNELNGVVSGFDRLVFHGHLPRITRSQGMRYCLNASGVLLKDFGPYVEQVSQGLKQASLAVAEREGRPVIYLKDNRQSKEELARSIAARDGISTGLVCVLTAVERCWSYRVAGDYQRKRLVVQPCFRRCLHLYHYWMSAERGLMSARIQSWFPFAIQVCINGREWLARQMDAAGLKYARQGNCFVWLEDYQQSQALLNAQLKTNWSQWLDGVAQQVNPLHAEIFRCYPSSYYWSVYQSEWATDLVFHQAETLRRHYSLWIPHALTTFGSANVMRFLGHTIPIDGKIPPRWKAELCSDVRRRAEGMRIKHMLNGNAVKAYDKAFTAVGNVLRVEMTMNCERDFRVYRPKEGGPPDQLQWLRLRRGVADLHRRAQVSQQVNERYLNALASLEDSTTLEELVGRLEQRTWWKGKVMRGLRLWDPHDARLLAAIGRGEFTINGVRNRDLQPLLFDAPPTCPKQARQRSAKVSRLLRLLRAHGFLRKLSHTHRYLVTENGRKALTAIMAARTATVAQLAQAA